MFDVVKRSPPFLGRAAVRRLKQSSRHTYSSSSGQLRERDGTLRTSRRLSGFGDGIYGLGCRAFPTHQAKCVAARQQGIKGSFMENQAQDGWRGEIPALPPTSATTCHAVRRRFCLLRWSANFNALVMLCVSCLVSVSR